MATSLHVPTPVIESGPLSRLVRGRVLLKLDCTQPTGSFKIRGIGHACVASRDAGASALVASSGGNAGLAVAYAGRHLGLPVTIVVPETTPVMMRERLGAEGARVSVHGRAWDAAHKHAEEITAQIAGAAYIHPFDDTRIWTGHASLVHELRDDGWAPDLIVTVVGGGGLLCGVLQGLHEVDWPHVPVLTMETEGADSFARSVAAGRLVTLDGIDSLATSLGARTVAAAALSWTQRHRVLAQTTTDRAAVAAVVRFADDHRLLVEPACGAALAAVYEPLTLLDDFGEILVIVCGGAGVTSALIDSWQQLVGVAANKGGGTA